MLLYTLNRSEPLILYRSLLSPFWTSNTIRCHKNFRLIELFFNCSTIGINEKSERCESFFESSEDTADSQHSRQNVQTSQGLKDETVESACQVRKYSCEWESRINCLRIIIFDASVGSDKAKVMLSNWHIGCTAAENFENKFNSG